MKKITHCKLLTITIALVCVILFWSCKRDQQIVDYKDYPNKVGSIIRSKCATSGCHNDASYPLAAGLNLSTWKDLFNGDNGGASVIPYNADYSPFMYFVNTYNDLGLTNVPVMPLNKPALSREEVLLLRNWINEGAPDRDGNVKFSDNLSRKKIYIAHTACGVVAVFDAETKLAMRYIPVLKQGETCTPHMVKLSPDKKYWYICYNSNGKYLRRYNANDDSYAGEVFIGAGEWNSFAITPDSKKAFVIDWEQNGKIAQCDLVNMKVIDTLHYQYAPHGSAVSPDGRYLYATATGGNYVYKIDISNGNVDYISLSPAEIPGQPSNTYNPHEILFSEDGSLYYVTCQNEKTVRVFDASTDNFINKVQLDGAALEMSISPSKDLLFVTSWDSHHFPGVLGAVAVINTTTNTLQDYLNVGTQPHGIALDEGTDMVYVANRNIDVSGPLPHHSSLCTGRNGYLAFVQLSTLKLLRKRTEIGVDPYSVAVRP